MKEASVSPSRPPPYMLSSNQVLHQGRYRVINQFGNIESGSLYEAYDTSNNTKVVLRETVGQLGKVATAAQIENLKTAFAADAKRLTEIKHPSLLSVQDYFSEIDRQYLVIEACEGSDLAELVKSSENGLSLGDVMRWADQLLDGLEYLHSKVPPIVHQAICPQNIRLASNFTIKLLVTGSERPVTAEGVSESPDAADQPYRALEQQWLALDSASQKMIANSFGERSEEILRQAADARTDLYSVGATLYYLLTRTVPADPLSRYLETVDGNDDPLQKASEIDPSIPADLCNSLMKAMELKREYRFDSARSMRYELSKVKIPLNSRLSEVKKPQPSVVEAAKEETSFNEDRSHAEEDGKTIDAEKRLQADLLKATRQDEERKNAEKLKAEKAAADRKAAAEIAASIQSKEKMRLETFEKQEVAKLQEDLAKDDLLDLPEHISEPAFVPQPAADVLALEVERPARAVTPETVDFDLFSETESKGSFIGRPLVMAAVAFVALFIVVGVWMFSGKGSSAPNPAAAIQNVTTPTAPATDTQNSFSPPVASTPSETPIAEQPVVTDSPNSPALTADAKAKADQLAKQKQLQKQQTKPTPEKKKSVTVDDLINDN